jgi:MFS transporter, FSR family, fosmidomycin resistance protein
MTTTSASATLPRQAALSVLLALSAAHLLNDTIQSLIPAIYPIIKQSYQLDYIQIGLITLTFQVSASLLQPLVGFVTDRHPMPYSMVAGMACSLIGLIALAHAGSYGMLLAASACVGLGSSIFHPEATRTARNASGGQHGFAQAVFQIGGQTGSAIGPLLAAFIIVPRGQTSLTWFSLAAFVAILLMIWIARSEVGITVRPSRKADAGSSTETEPAARPLRAAIVPIAVLIILLFSKYAYTASFTSFYTFYLMSKFGVTIQTSQLMLFLFLASSAAGALGGGIVGDRIGRKPIIWFSILGALPFTLILPYADLFWTGVLTIVINLIMSSAFAAILIYALELLPGRIGLVSGFFYGVTFGLAGIAAALLGALADQIGIETVYRMCAYLPAMGLLAWFLPRLSTAAER